MIGSRLNGGHLGRIEYKYPVHSHNIHSLATVNYQLPRGKTLFHLPFTHILEIFKDSSSTTRKYSKTFSPANLSEPQISNNPKIFKDFFACKFVLAANHQLYPGNIRRLSGQQSTASTSSSNQQQLPTAATSSSYQQQQPAATTNSSNQQHQPAAATNSNNQPQQSAASTSSSNQQQHSAATINSSNQQHRSAAATSTNNQQQRPKATTSFVLPASPPQSTTTHVR